MDVIMDTYPEGLLIRLAHVGINTGSASESRATAEKMARMFCTYVRSGNNSNFVSDMFEIVRFKGRGTHGHIGMETNSVSLALDYLRTLGIEADMSTAKYKEDGTLRHVYLKDEIQGFAFHLNLMN